MNLNEIEDYIKSNLAVLVYISTTECNVCKALKPKVEELLTNDFPKMKFIYIESNKQADIAAQYSVFTVPTILVFFDGKEHIRKSRFIGIGELFASMERTYNLIF